MDGLNAVRGCTRCEEIIIDNLNTIKEIIDTYEEDIKHLEALKKEFDTPTQTFDTVAEKNVHVLDHFVQETCSECNQNLIQIGGEFYVKHSAVTCINRQQQSIEQDETIQPHYIDEPSVSEGQMDGETHDELMTIPVKLESDASQGNDFTFDASNSPEIVDFSNEIFETKAEPRQLMDFMTSEDDFSYGTQQLTDSTTTFQAEMELMVDNTDYLTQNMVCVREVQIKTETFEQNDQLNIVNENDEAETQTRTPDLEATEAIGTIQNENATNKNKQKHECDICGKMFGRISSLKGHKTTSNCKRRINISKVRTSAVKSMSKAKRTPMKRHQVTKTSTIKEYGCFECKETFKSMKSLCDHMQMPHETFGPVEFSAIEDEETHELEHSMEEKPAENERMCQLECYLCKKAYDSVEHLRSHMEYLHFECSTFGIPTRYILMILKIIAQRSFPAELAEKATDFLIYYLLDTLNNGDRSFLDEIYLVKDEILGTEIFAPDLVFCNECRDPFPHVKDRDTHELNCLFKPKNQSLELVDQFECYICKIVYKSENYLRSHMKHLHTPMI